MNEQLSLRVPMSTHGTYFHNSSMFTIVTFRQEQNQPKSGHFLVETEKSGQFLVEKKDKVGHQENDQIRHFEDYKEILNPSNIPKVTLRN